MRTITSQQFGLFFAAASAAVLVAVFISQYGFDMHPCKLCLWQRWPYAIAFALGFGLVVTRRKPVVWLAFLALTFATSTGLAVFHYGVEQHWWIFNSDCASNVFQAGSTIDILAAIKRAPVVKCDQAVPFLFGQSMSFYNILTSLGLTVMALVSAVYSSRSSSLSQYK